MAETFTEALRLSKRDTGDLNWGAGANANLDLLDKHAQLKLLRPPRTLLGSLGSGSVGSNLLGSTTYFYRITAFNAAGETTENAIPIVLVAQITEPATPVPVILQWETVKGASGYRIYKSSVLGQEKFLAEVAGESTATYTDDGNTATNSGISVPTSNTARTSVSKIIAGTGITVNPSSGLGDVTINASGVGGVTSLRKTGQGTGLTGDVSLDQGSGITLTQDQANNKIIIASSAPPAIEKFYFSQFISSPTFSWPFDGVNRALFDQIFFTTTKTGNVLVKANFSGKAQTATELHAIGLFDNAGVNTSDQVNAFWTTNFQRFQIVNVFTNRPAGSHNIRLMVQGTSSNTIFIYQVVLWEIEVL